METKMKKLAIILTGVLYFFFMIGYTVGIEREKKTLINMCSEKLQIEPDQIKSVKYKGNSLVINLKSNTEKLSLEDKSIYNKFEPELVLNLKDAVKKQNICIQ